MRRLAVLSAAVLTLAPQAARPSFAAIQGQAGGPIFDCTREREAAVVLSRGLDGLNDKIQRTERQLIDAKQSGRNEEIRKESAEANRDFAVDYAAAIQKLGLVKAALRRVPMTSATAENIDKLLDGANKAYEHIGKNPKAMAKLSMADVDTLQQKVSALARFIADSGVGGQALEVAATLGPEAGILAGPVGELVLATGVFAIDTIYVSEKTFMDALEEQRAADLLNQLRAQKNDIMERIQLVVDNCGSPRTQQVQNSPQPIPPSDAAAGTSAAAPPAPPKKGSAGKTAAKTAGVVGVGVGTYVALDKLDLGNISGGSSSSGSGSSGSGSSGGGSSGGSGGGSSSVRVTVNAGLTCGPVNAAGTGRTSGCSGGSITVTFGQSFSNQVVVAATSSGFHGTATVNGSTATFSLSVASATVACPPTQTGVSFYRDVAQGSPFASATTSIPVRCN